MNHTTIATIHTENDHRITKIDLIPKLQSSTKMKCTLPCRIAFLLDFLSIACIHLVVLSIDPVPLAMLCPPYFVSVD